MEETNQGQNQQQEVEPQTDQPQGPTKKEKNVGMAIVAYIIFFIPLLTEAKKDPFVKYHVKQGLLLFVGWIAVAIISYILPWQLWIITRLLNIGLLILMIIGIAGAVKGEKKPLPLIGKFAEKFKF